MNIEESPGPKSRGFIY